MQRDALDFGERKKGISFVMHVWVRSFSTESLLSDAAKSDRPFVGPILQAFFLLSLWTKDMVSPKAQELIS